MATLVIYQGGSLDAEFVLTADDGTAIPLASDGYDRAAMQVRDRPGAVELLFDASTSPSPTQGQLTIEPGGVTGVVQLTAGGDITGRMPRGGEFDCLVWKSADPKRVLVAGEGNVELRRRVTVT